MVDTPEKYDWERRYRELKALLDTVVSVSNKEREEHEALKQAHAKLVRDYSDLVGEMIMEAKASL